MLQNPFGDPFQPGTGSAHSEIFRRRGGGVRPRRPDAAPEAAHQADLEPEAAPESAEEASEETPGEKAVLRNPKWEVETVGFNEETDISVEVELPEAHAHKTRVVFELFAKTPDGPEAISKAQGTIQGGKAKARIPVYMPQYRDEEGNLLAEVEYFFTAKHSLSELLKDETVVKLVSRMAERLIQSHILTDITFATGLSFPRNVATLESLAVRIGEWKKAYPEGKLAVFGHADAIGEEARNKTLSERRARAIQAYMAKDVEPWKALHDHEKWGLATTQVLLKHLGHDPGAIDGKEGPGTQAALKAFQAKAGIAQSGQADTATREALYTFYMDKGNSPALASKDFEDIDGKPYMGCSEFNLVQAAKGACERNRRVAVLLLKSNRNFPIHFPCVHGDVGPCKRQVGSKGSRRSEGFGCKFYDRLVIESRPEESSTASKRRIRILDCESRPIASACIQAEGGAEIRPDAEGWCDIDESMIDGKALTVELGTLALHWNPDESDTGVA